MWHHGDLPLRCVMKESFIFYILQLYIHCKCPFLHMHTYKRRCCNAYIYWYKTTYLLMVYFWHLSAKFLLFLFLKWVKYLPAFISCLASRRAVTKICYSYENNNDTRKKNWGLLYIPSSKIKNTFWKRKTLMV